MKAPVILRAACRCLPLLCLVFAACRPATNQSRGVQLILSTEDLGPGTTFELRFDEPVAPPGQVGLQADVSPLKFEPTLGGHFLWTSPRSGIFTPDEPLALGTEYRLSLRRGLLRADGQPVAAMLNRVLRTPAFGVASVQSADSSTNATSEPEFHLWFNADTKASAVAARAEFVSADGQWVQASVHQGTELERYAYNLRGEASRTWLGTFEEQRRAPTAHNSRETGPEPDPFTSIIPNLVIVTPVQALSVGHHWRLVVAPGVPSADGRLSSNDKFEGAVGDVQPFTFDDNEMHHVINREPYLSLEFSKCIDPALTNSFTNWVQITPWPEGLTASVDEQTLTLSGGWKRWLSYTVTVRRGLPAVEHFALAKNTTFKTSVPPVEPRLYFPEFSTEQFAGGNRAFPLLAVNTEQVKVQAKLLEQSTAIYALRGYESYLNGRSNYYRKRRHFVGTGPYRRLDYNLVPGRTIYSREFTSLPQNDEGQTIELKWDQVLKGRSNGVVFLQAERNGAGDDPNSVLGSQALVQLTDLGLLWKVGGGQVQVFVFSYATGQPVTNAEVRIYSDENEVLAQTGTDFAGRATLPHTREATWVAAQCGEDFHVVPLDENNVPVWWFDLPHRGGYEPTSETRRAALFTDRDAYRPNETVNLKAIVRDLQENGLTIPAGATGLVACVDAQGKQFFRTNFTLSALGSCGTAIPLPAGPNGTYQLKLDFGPGHEFLKQIQVADFQPAAFEVKLQAKESYGPDEDFSLPLSARYFFGKELSRASVHWWVEAYDREFQPEGFANFVFARGWVESDWGRQQGNFSTSGEAKLQAGTNCLLQFAVPLNPKAPQPRWISLLTEVTDLDQQTLTRSLDFVKHSSDYYLGIKQFQQVIEAGTALPLELTAVCANGMPPTNTVSAHLSLKHIEWQSIQVQGAGRSVSYRREAVLTNVFDREVTINPAVKLENGEQGYRGTVVEDIVPPGAGEYLVELTGRDEHGHEIASSFDFDVTARAGLAWNYKNDVELKLAPDKPSYRPRETALLLVKAPFSGQGFVTVEREKVLRSFVVQLDGNAPAVRIPIEAGDAPNVFVSVTLLRGADASTHQIHKPEYRVGYCELEVQDPTNQLQVEVSVAATNCLPAQTVQAMVQLRDAAGQPVPGAEVTLYAVDEGVLGLTDYSVPNLKDTLLAARRLDVQCGISLPLLMSEDPEQLTFHNKGYLGGGGGKEPAPRRRFMPCAYWNASLLTDADGRVSASFVAPDSLTRYRVIAVAHSLQNQFGSGKTEFTVSKPLSIEPALPQVANVSDHLRARAVVQNQTAEFGQVLVSLQLDDKAQNDTTNLSRTVSIEPHGTAAVEFPITLGSTGTARWLWRARFADQTIHTNQQFIDSVQSTLRVGNITPLLREVAVVRLDGGETNLLRALNPQLLTGSGTLDVTIANTRMVMLREAVQQLLQYPYGCVEQTSSSLLPWVVLQDTPALLAFTRHDSAEATQTAKAGIARLFTMQTPSGGLSYWPGEQQPMFWGSAYAGFVLALAQRAGLPVPEHEFDLLLKYLSSQLRAVFDDGLDSNAQCLALYVLALAGRAEPAYHSQFYEKRARLNAEERSLLALAINQGGNNSSLVQELLHGNESLRVCAGDPFDCPIREKAIGLLARASIHSEATQADKLFCELQAEQKHGHWYTTQGNAWALLAAREYLRQTESDAKSCSGKLSWNQEQHEFQLPPGCGVFTNAFKLEPPLADRPFLLTNFSGEPLYVQLTLESRLPKLSFTRQDHGFSLQRRYDRLNDENEPEPSKTFCVGDRLLVTLRLSVPEPAEYVAIDDALPGVLEPLNSEFKTQQLSGRAVPATWQTEQGESYWWSNFHEVRADRVLFFGDHVSAGNYVLRYVARVRAAGAVTAPVAKVEEMYNPERFGLTEPLTITTRAVE